MILRDPRSSRLRTAGFRLLAVASVFVATASRAEEPAAATSGAEESPPSVVPYQRDAIGGHFQVGATGALVTPFGKASEGVRVRDRAGPGGGAQLDLGFGVNRHVFLGAFGELTWLGDTKRCDSCSGSTFAGGLFARYHLVQGLRVDPWVSYGIGYRGLESNAGDLSRSYHGVDWLRLQLGATWYVTSGLGLGPVLQLDAGTMIGRPEEEAPGGTHLSAQLGLRVALDVPGR